MQAITDETLDFIIIDLIGIWKYAALDKHVENDNKKSSEEYAITIMKMWDYLDKLPLSTVESVVIDIEGKLLETDPEKQLGGEDRTNHKIIRSQLEQYIEARLETGELSTE